MVELLSPIGDFASLRAAIKAGCNSVYFGVAALNMRQASAKNFDFNDMPEIAKICKEAGIKSCLTMNVVIYDSEMSLVDEILDRAKAAGIDAVIAMDNSVIQKANEKGIEVHLSTQANVSNYSAVKFYSKFADRIVLARELNLGQIREIKDKIISENIKGPNGRILELECFVHGALCIAVSGSCYKSLFTENHSANRGECLQNCRREYTVTDDSNKQLKVVNNYIMSPADLCTVDFVDKLVEAGIDVFKIEGRAKGADYVFEVTRAYREALNAIEKNSYTFELRKELRGRLEKVYNRGFGDGYFLGQTLDDWSKQYGSKATEKKFFVGNVKHFYSDISVAEILLEAGELNIGDEISVIGDTTGFFRQKILEMQFEKNPVQKAEKGSRIAIKVSEKVRVGDKVYVIQKASGEQEFTKTAWV